MLLCILHVGICAQDVYSVCKCQSDLTVGNIQWLLSALASENLGDEEWRGFPAG